MLSRAKINLSLRVEGQRADGYHVLSGLVAFADIGDEISVQPADALTLTIDGPYAHGLSTTNNLVLEAAHVLQQKSGVISGAAIHLTKHLPIASGVGGGSSNAATTLLLLQQLWQVEVDLAPLGALLGADVPMCLHNRGCYVQGVGDDITVLPPLPPLYAILVNPGVAVPTAAIFQAGFAAYSTADRVPNNGFTDHHQLLAWLQKTNNDLIQNATAYAPAIAEVLAGIDALDNCLLARMSGSGATCFGLFASKNQAELAAKMLRAHQPDWWVVATCLS